MRSPATFFLRAAPAARAPLSLLLAAASAAGAAAQTSFSVAAGVGDEVLIIGDVDGLGRRDVVVTDTGNGTPGRFMIYSSDTGVVLATVVDPQAAPFGLFGRALANVGDVNGDGADDFAVSTPVTGRVTVYSGQLSGGGVVPLRILTGVANSFGYSLANVGDLNGSGGRELAVGSPLTDQVFVYDVTTNPATQLYVLSDPRLGQFGTSLALGPNNRLAVGAPFYAPSNLPPNSQVGYVTVFTLSAGAGIPLVTYYRGVAFERFGYALAATGPTSNNGTADFAILAPLAGVVHLFSNPVPPTPPSFNYGVASTAVQRLATLGDVDGDGRGDFALTDYRNLRVFTTPAGAAPVQIAFRPGPMTFGYNGGLAAGPDVLGMGGVDLVATFTINTTSAQVNIEPLAESISLPNPPSLALAVSQARPTPGANYPFTITAPGPSVPVFLLGDLAPITPTPFGNGTAYVGTTGSAVTLFFGTTPANYAVTMPTSPVFLGQALLYQATTWNGSTFLVSNGIMARLGSW